MLWSFVGAVAAVFAVVVAAATGDVASPLPGLCQLHEGSMHAVYLP